MTNSTEISVPSLEERILTHLGDEDAPVPRAELRRALRVNNHRLGKAITHLLHGGQIISTPDGVTLP
ncbi:MAG: hypothetical protein ACYC3I_24135 [Gemmataceae bacterium]